jgi:hypothetical protein
MAESAELKAVRAFEQELTNQLATLERNILDQETEYIESTSASGNIIHGWDGFQDR